MVYTGISPTSKTIHEGKQQGGRGGSQPSTIEERRTAQLDMLDVDGSLSQKVASQPQQGPTVVLPTDHEDMSIDDTPQNQGKYIIILPVAL